MDTSMNEPRQVRAIWRVILWVTLALVLTIPAVAMQITADVDWSASDFIVMGALLAALGLGIELVMRFVRTWPVRFGAIAVALAVFLAVWAELAVGVFGTPIAGS